MDFVAINFSEYFKSTWERLYSKLNKEQNCKKVGESFYIFLKTPNEVEKYVETMQSNSPDNCVYCFNVEILSLFDSVLQLKLWLEKIKRIDKWV